MKLDVLFLHTAAVTAANIGYLSGSDQSLETGQSVGYNMRNASSGVRYARPQGVVLSGQFSGGTGLSRRAFHPSALVLVDLWDSHFIESWLERARAGRA